MSPRRVLAVVGKEVAELTRDPITLVVCLVMPLALLFVFGYAIVVEVENVPLGVLDLDRSRASRDLIDRFAVSQSFRLVAVPRETRAVEADLLAGRVKVALVIPPDFSRDLEQGRGVVQILADGTHAATALLASGHAREIVHGFPSPPARIIHAETRIWFNPALRSFDYIVPGLYAVILMALPPLLTALAIVREKESGSIEQIYASSLTAGEFVAGKLVPYAGVALVQMALIVTVGYAWFRVPFRGSLALFVGTSILYVLTTVGIGLLVSAITRTQLVAMLLALILTMMPSFLYSGFLFPIFTMPVALQLFSRAFPTSYFLEVSRSIVLKAAGIDLLWPNLVLLAAYTAAVFALSAWRLRMKVA